ncbi:MAG: phosphatidylglycerophosphatase A, partial [Pseudomonadales bacterium]|nr:phosphatidylglycerophosphatase A [Pseudomonadales bacterium]
LMAPLTLALQAVIIGCAFVVGIWFCELTSRNLGVHDHGGIVWDEFVGYWLAMLFAPPGWIWLLIGFVLFRVFDIVKPWPIRVLDKKVHGGFGIMIDDIIAGLFAGLCLLVLGHWLV